MSPRDVYMLGFTLSCVGLVVLVLLNAGQMLFPSVVAPPDGASLWLTGLFFIGSLIRWLARCANCDLSLIWRYHPDAPKPFRYSSMNWLPPKTCSRCGDRLE